MEGKTGGWEAWEGGGRERGDAPMDRGKEGDKEGVWKARREVGKACVV